jgi:hypothetical protein
MQRTNRFSILATAVALSLSLGACSWSGDNGNEVPGLALLVTPAKGAFGLGAKCDAFDGASGAFLATSLTDVSGNCSLQTGQFRGPVVVRVCGGASGVTVFDETLTTPANVPLGATECLVAAAPGIPAGNSPSMGVTRLTHIAAVATSFYGAGFGAGIVGLVATLRPDADGDGTPTVPPIPTGVLGSSLTGG